MSPCIWATLFPKDVWVTKLNKLFLKYILSPKSPSAQFIRNGEVSALDLRVLRTNGTCWVAGRINKPRLPRTVEETCSSRQRCPCSILDIARGWFLFLRCMHIAQVEERFQFFKGLEPSHWKSLIIQNKITDFTWKSVTEQGSLHSTAWSHSKINSSCCRQG